MRKLNIGSGRSVLEGWDNLDNHKKFGANIILDMNKVPYLIKSNTYDYILASYVLEHFNDSLSQLDEWLRILNKGGRLEIIVPYGDLCFDSIDHRKIFYLMTFIDAINEGDFGREAIKNVKLEYYGFYTRQTKIWARMKVSLFNFFIKIHPKIIDYTLLRFLCKGVSIRVIYRKEK